MRRHLLILTALLLAAPLPSAYAADAIAPELRTEEIYIPYEEFLKVAGKEGATMTLEEYRALVALATETHDARKQAALPAVKYSLAETVYKAVAGESAVRVDAAFKLTAAQKEWMRCDLGPLLPGLGSITLDGEPGWVVTENGRAFLLLHGSGAHSGTLSFSLPIKREEDVQSISGQLLNSAAAVFHLEAPGSATAVAELNPLDVTFDSARNVTSISLALGRDARLALSWRIKHETQKNDALLLAEEHISYLLYEGSPSFRWNAHITISRKKADEIFITEPPGGRMVRLSGANVHSWSRDGETLHVLLEKPMLGALDLQGEGVVVSANANLELGCPAIKFAAKDTRYAALFVPGERKIAIEKTSGFKELSPDETAMPEPAALSLVEGTPVRARLSHLFLLEAQDARLTVRVNAQAPLFDTQALFSATITERQVMLRAILGVYPSEGRVYSVVLNVPSAWTLTDLRERAQPVPAKAGAAPAPNPGQRGIRAEMRREGELEIWTLSLSDAADAAHPFELDALFTLRDLNWGENAWQTRALNFTLPSITGARRASDSLAFIVHPSINIAFGQMPAWRTESSARFEQLGMKETALRAGFVTDGPAGEVRLDLTRKKPRGEYDLVAHVLTLEREYWVRADIRLAVVDRAIDELVVSLPSDAKDPLYVNGLEIKEWLPGAEPGQRRIRFNRQWQGVRMIRIEYRAPLAPDTDMPVPGIRLEGDFDGRRRIVFQSTGAVELKVEPGTALLPASMEDTPDFAVPFQNGRALFAFTLASGTTTAGNQGTFRSRIFERAPVLSNVVRELNLATTVDVSGVSRTHAIFTLQYAREQYMPIKLPAGAKLVALSVDDQGVRPVQSTGANVVAVPLPPRSSARIELIYERRLGALSSFGDWDESGPDLLNIPVGMTNWKIYYPPEFKFALKEGNVAVDVPEQPGFFALSFWGAMFSGGLSLPRWTAWERTLPPSMEKFGAPKPPRAAPTVETDSQQLRAEEKSAPAEDLNGRTAGALAIPEGATLLASKLGGSPVIVLSYRANVYSRFAARSVFILAVLIGVWLARRPSKRALYTYIILGLTLGTAVPPAINWQSPMLAVPFCEGLSALAACVLISLVWRGIQQIFRKTETYPARAATAAVILVLMLPCIKSSQASESEPVLIPYAKEDVLSPDAKPGDKKVFVPKSVFRELMLKAHPASQHEQLDLPNWDDRRNIASAIPLTVAAGRSPAFTLTLPKAEKADTVRLFLAGKPEIFSTYKLELSEDGSDYEIVADRDQGQYRGWQTETFAPRIVKSIRISGVCSEGEFSVSSAEVFTPPSTVSVAPGNARYELSVTENAYGCKGTLDIATFDPEAWVKAPLDFGLCEVVAASIDGQTVSVGHERGVPFVQIQGAGKHKVDVELRGALTLSPGRAQLQARFVTGTATRLALTLPADVELDTRSLPSGAWIEKNADAKTQRCEIDLGGGNPAGVKNDRDAPFQSRDVALGWHSADIRGKAATQIAARNYSLLQLGSDGYSVYRMEAITSDGGGADQLTYKLLGRWEITSVTATGLAEWLVSGEGEDKRLRLWFQKPVNETLVQIAGWADLRSEKPGAETQVAALILEGAVRQEGFIGLQHGDGLRFTPRSLEGLKRASSQELSAMFTLPAESLPDRIYHCHEPPLNYMVSAEPEPWLTSIETHIVGVVEPTRLTACVRSRYTANGRTAFRHEVELPPGWEIGTVRCNAMRNWEVAADGGKRRLVVYFTSHATTGVEVIWSAERPLELPARGPLALDLPLLRASGDSKTTETLDWIVAADQSLALSESAATTMHSLPLDRAPAWVQLDANQEYQFAFRSAKPDSKLVVDVSKRSSVVSATVVSFLRAAEDFVQINARCRFHIEQAGMDHFTLKLPAGAQLLSLATRNLQERTVTERPDGSVVSIRLQSSVTGEQMVDVALRLARAPGQDVTVGPISFEDPEFKQVEHFVGIMQAEHGQVVIAGKKGLNKPLESEALPFIPERISSAALAQVFVADPDWSLTLRQPDVKVEVGQAAEVALAVIKTVIAADGGVRSVVNYTIRNRSLQFLSIALPEDATLWGVTVDGQAVTVGNTVRGARKVLLVPIQRMGMTDLPIEAALVYESAHVNLPAAYISVTPLAPEVLDIPVIETYWQVFVPSDYEVTRSGGNLKDVAASVLIGGRLKSNMSDVERLMEVADGSSNSYQKRNALRGVARKQQELSDYATELDNESGKQLDPDEARRIGRDDWQGQLSANSVIRQQANAWQQKLSQRSKDLEEAVAGGADAEQQQAFLDSYNFLGNKWRNGARYKKTVEAPKLLIGDVSWLLLRNIHSFAGFGNGELPPPPAAPISEHPEPLPVGPGLRDDSADQLHLKKNPISLIVPEMGTKLTFSRLEGNPQLTITLRSRTSSWRYSSIGALLLVIAAAAFAYRRRKRHA